MKKIISVLTISALALGSVFAADIKLAYNQKGYLSTNEGGKSKKLDLNGYQSSEKVKGDCVFSVSADNVGVLVDIDPFYKEEGRVSISSSNEVFDQYYGYVKFFDGAFKLQSGVWTARSVNRLNKDGGKWEDNEYEMNKLGVIGGSIGKDVTRFAAFNGSTALTTALTYTGENFYVTGGLIKSDFKSVTTDVGTTETKAGFGLEAGVTIDEDTKLQAILKSPKDQTIVFAAFLDKKNFEMFDRSFDVVAGLTLGGESGKDTTEASNLNNGFEGAFDLRVRYQVNDTVAITSMNNFSYLGNVAGYNGEGKKTIWNMLSVAVQASDEVKFTVTGQWLYDDLSKPNNGYFSVTPGIQYSPVAGTSLTGGIIIKTFGWRSPSESSIAVPFVLSVAL